MMAVRGEIPWIDQMDLDQAVFLGFLQDAKGKRGFEHLRKNRYDGKSMHKSLAPGTDRRAKGRGGRRED